MRAYNGLLATTICTDLMKKDSWIQSIYSRNSNSKKLKHTRSKKASISPSREHNFHRSTKSVKALPRKCYFISAAEWFSLPFFKHDSFPWKISVVIFFCTIWKIKRLSSFLCHSKVVRWKAKNLMLNRVLWVTRSYKYKFI